MSTVYSKLLLRGSSSSTVGIAFTAPAGFVTVVRDIELWYGGVKGTGSLGCEIFDQSFAIIFGIYPPVPVAGNPYHYEGRQVLNAGDVLTVQPLDAGWHYRISGYELTLP